MSGGADFCVEGLAGGGQHRAPAGAIQIQALLLADQQFDRYMNKEVMQQADHQTGLAGHRGVDGVAGEEIAENRVLGVRRDAADQVAGIEIAQRRRNALRLKVMLNALAQERADVLELDVARGVAFLAAGRQQFLASALGYTITACARWRIRCFSAARKPSSPSRGRGISGMKVKFTS